MVVDPKGNLSEVWQLFIVLKPVFWDVTIEHGIVVSNLASRHKLFGYRVPICELDERILL